MGSIFEAYVKKVQKGKYNEEIPPQQIGNDEQITKIFNKQGINRLDSAIANIKSMAVSNPNILGASIVAIIDYLLDEIKKEVLSNKNINVRNLVSQIIVGFRKKMGEWETELGGKQETKQQEQAPVENPKQLNK